eukprot:c2917_g1_i1 orf=457-2088(-)
MEVAAEEEAVVLLSKVLRASTHLMRVSEGEDEDEDEGRMALQRLIHLSRSPAVRSLLAASDAVPSLLSLVAQNPPSPLLLLKLLRNLCAGDPSNQEAFSRSHGAQSVALVVDKALDLLTQRHAEMASILQVCLQLLGNACGGGKAEKEAVWTAFFPDRFRALARMNGEDKVLEPLLMVLYTCSQGEAHRLKDLCHGDGALLLSSCLQPAASTGVPSNGAGDWIYLLILNLCQQQPLLPLLFETLGAWSECSQERLFSVEQVTLLGYLLDILSNEAQAYGTEIDLLALIEFLAQTLRIASRSYRGPTAQTIAGSAYAIRPCGIPAIDILGYTLELFKLLSGWEDGNQVKGGKNDRSSIVAALLHHGVIKLCMELLECLGPPDLIHRAMQGGNVDLTAEYGDRAPKHDDVPMPEGSGLTADQVEEPSKVTRAALPYQGYRRDLVAIVGNASHGSHTVQDEVRNLGGLFLILQQCVVDEANPYLREWGLWAIRNLVDGNMENCKEIAELQLRGSLTPVELAQMGYKVEMDFVLGRPKLVNTPSGRD